MRSWRKPARHSGARPRSCTEPYARAMHAVAYGPMLLRSLPLDMSGVDDHFEAAEDQARTAPSSVAVWQLSSREARVSLERWIERRTSRLVTAGAERGLEASGHLARTKGQGERSRRGTSRDEGVERDPAARRAHLDRRGISRRPHPLGRGLSHRKRRRRHGEEGRRSFAQKLELE